MITFNNPKIDKVLKNILKNSVTYLSEDEVAQGIVPNPDVINSRNIKKISQSNIDLHNINSYKNVNNNFNRFKYSSKSNAYP